MRTGITDSKTSGSCSVIVMIIRQSLQVVFMLLMTVSVKAEPFATRPDTYDFEQIVQQGTWVRNAIYERSLALRGSPAESAYCGSRNTYTSEFLQASFDKVKWLATSFVEGTGLADEEPVIEGKTNVAAFTRESWRLAWNQNGHSEPWTYTDVRDSLIVLKWTVERKASEHQAYDNSGNLYTVLDCVDRLRKSAAGGYGADYYTAKYVNIYDSEGYIRPYGKCAKTAWDEADWKSTGGYGGFYAVRWHAYMTPSAGWSLSASRAKSKAKLTDVPSIDNVTMSWSMYFLPSPAGQFADLDGLGFQAGKLHEWDSGNGAESGSDIVSRPIGDSSETWPLDYDTGEEGEGGLTCDRAYWILKWDFTPE